MSRLGIRKKKKAWSSSDRPLTEEAIAVYFRLVGTWLSLVEHCIRETEFLLDLERLRHDFLDDFRHY